LISEEILFYCPFRPKAVIACAVLCVALTGKALAGPVITNGGFETGDLTGWSVFVQNGGNGSFYNSSSTVSPLTGYTTPGPASGVYYAISDQNGPSAEALIQSFTVPGSLSGATLTFRMFVNTYAPVSNATGLDYTSGDTFAPNQYARVDLLSGSATAFDTGSGVLANFYLGADPMADGGTNSYTSYSFDLTPYIAGGGTFQLRFADVANQATINVGIDDVSISTTTPEPSAAVLIAVGLLVVAVGKLRHSD
jgi:hypothetical protein